MTTTLHVFVVNTVDRDGRRLSRKVTACDPDEAMTIIERSGFDYVEAEVLLNGEQVAVYDDAQAS